MKTKFDEIEVELVMDVYGVDRERACAILLEKHAAYKARCTEEKKPKRTYRKFPSPIILKDEDEFEKSYWA